MADSPHPDQTLSVNASYETVATEPISQPPAEDSETDVDEDDLNTTPAAPPSANKTVAQNEEIQVETSIESEPQSPDESPLQQKQQSREQAPRASDDSIAAKEEDNMLFAAMTTPGSNSKTYGKSSRQASHTPSLRDEEVGLNGGSGPGSKGGRGAKRKAAARPHIYEAEAEPAKKSKGRLPKVARSDDDSALKEPEDEMVVAPSTTRRRIPSSDKLTTPISRGPPKKALFSGYNPAGSLTKLLKRSGVERVDEATSRMDYVCVVPSTPLKTTPKVLKSLIANKPLVTEEWLSDSKKAGSLLEVDSYIHKDVVDTDRRSLFNGKILFFTSAAKRSYGGGWDDISQIAKAVGATSVESGSAITGHNITPKDRVIFFGLDQEDKDAAALIRDHARIVYVKSMLTETIVKASFAEESRITLDSQRLLLLARRDAVWRMCTGLQITPVSMTYLM